MKKTVAGVRQSSTVNIIKYLKEKEREREGGRSVLVLNYWKVSIFL